MARRGALPAAAPGAPLVQAAEAALWLLLLWLLLLVPLSAATLGSWKSAATSSGLAFASSSPSLALNSCATPGLSVLGISCSLDCRSENSSATNTACQSFQILPRVWLKGCSCLFHSRGSLAQDRPQSAAFEIPIMIGIENGVRE